MIESAGFTEVEIVGPVDVFEGAAGEDNARAFETYGYTFRAVKVRDVEAQLAVPACDVR